MTEQTPQAEPAVQVVVLDDARTSTLIVDGVDGAPSRVFYDLDHLFNQYAPEIMARGLVARLTQDPEALAQVRGETLLLEGIRQSIDALRLEADFNR